VVVKQTSSNSIISSNIKGEHSEKGGSVLSPCLMTVRLLPLVRW
jgi:hypothetical protein